MKIRKQRNWSLYNQKLKDIARIDFFISEEAIGKWEYAGKRAAGGKLLYSNHVIELCLMLREFYQLAYRQTEGFVESIFKAMGLDLPIPDYTTIARRAAKLSVSISATKGAMKQHREAIVVAMDSTGMSVYTKSEWNRVKHAREDLSGGERWRKLHVAIDVGSGEILSSRYTRSNVNDGVALPGMLEEIEQEVSAVCADMPYDTVNCRKAIGLKKARQLIPPMRAARVAKDNRNISKKYQETLHERDEAIKYIQHNAINGDTSLSRKAWKERSGYHARSLVETTMWQIKSHCSDRLTNRREDTRQTQTRIKCKVINLIIAA